TLTGRPFFTKSPADGLVAAPQASTGARSRRNGRPRPCCRPAHRAESALPVHRRQRRPGVVPFGASMTISTAVELVRPSDEAAAKRGERRALGVAGGGHMLHDGYTDLVWVALPIWQAEFGLNYAVVGLLRTMYSGTLASLQIPAAAIAARIGAGTVLSAGTALAGLCYCLAGLSPGFALLVL